MWCKFYVYEIEIEIEMVYYTNTALHLMIYFLSMLYLDHILMEWCFQTHAILRVVSVNSFAPDFWLWGSLTNKYKALWSPALSGKNWNSTGM